MSNRSHHAGNVPVLETERLIMRGQRLDDFRQCAAMWADPDITRYISGKPLSEEEVWSKFLRNVGHWTLMGYGVWVLEEKATGRFLGELGVGDFKRNIQPSFGDMPEFAWVLAAHAQGKGYATEAAHAAIAWSETHFGPVRSKRMVCLIDPENLPSLRVAEKCGFREFQRTTYHDKPTIVLIRSR